MSDAEQSRNSAVLDFSGVHRLMRGFLTKTDSAVDGSRGDPARAKKFADLVLFGVDGLRFHHHIEDDEYWPALVEKGADPSLLEPLRASHREIDPLLDRLEVQARDLRSAPSDTALALLAETLHDFRSHVRQHLDEEEPIIFPLLEEHISNAQAHTMAARAAKTAPRKGLSWLMGGVTYAMTPTEAENFLSVFPKPILWLRPLLLRTYRRNCAALGLEPEFSH